MNRAGNSIVAFVFLMLTACASQPKEDHYYSLVLAADDVAAPARTDTAARRIIVGPIHLARYLDQSGLAMQVGTNQIRTANHHFWAEPLDEAIGKVLVRDISQRVGAVAVDRDAGRWTPGGDCRLRVEFDKFHATDDARVVATGRYWIHDSAREEVAQSEFNIVQTLSANGYTQAVRQLRVAIESLAAEIAEQLSNIGDCTA